MITIVQTIISLYLFHKLYMKKNCGCVKYKILDTILVILSFIPAFAIFVNIIFPTYISITIILISLAFIFKLKGYGYSVEKFFEHKHS